MLKKIWRTLRNNWPASVLLLTIIAAWGLQLGKLNLPAHILLIVVMAGFAVPPLITTWQNLQSGVNQVTVLVPISVIGALLTRHYWIAVSLIATSHSTHYVLNTVQRRSERAAERRKHVIPEVVSVMRGRKVLETAVNAVHIGDKIVCQPDEIVAFDSQIVSGETLCDETLLGGDNTQRSKGVGDILLSGSRNVSQPVTLKVMHVASDSYYQKTTLLLRKSVGDQTALVRTSDRYSLYLTVSALLIAAAAWYLGHGANRFVAVLAVATVAPVIIPARLALTAAVVSATKRGIIVHSGAALQKLAEARAFVFGYSGILTDDIPTVEQVTAVEPYTKTEVLGLAASLEHADSKPIARAIVAAAEAQGFNFIKAKHVQVLPSQGLQANLQGREILVGNAGLMTEHGIQLPVKVNTKQLTLYVAAAGALVGTISLRNPVRSSAQKTLEQLRRSGVAELYIVSSVAQPVVESNTKSLGSLTVHADTSLPAQLATLAAIAQRPAVYVGQVADDSLLAAADLGIILGDNNLQANRGPGVAILHNDIAYVAVARSLVRRALSRAQLSMVLGVVASLAAMLVALSGSLPLLLGVVLQLLINCFVIIYPVLAGSQKT